MKPRGGEAFLPETVVLKLNGGLGTSMGLDKAKSLLPVKGDDSFLDLTAKQVRYYFDVDTDVPSCIFVIHSLGWAGR